MSQLREGVSDDAEQKFTPRTTRLPFPMCGSAALAELDIEASEPKLGGNPFIWPITLRQRQYQIECRHSGWTGLILHLVSYTPSMAVIGRFALVDGRR